MKWLLFAGACIAVAGCTAGNSSSGTAALPAQAVPAQANQARPAAKASTWKNLYVANVESGVSIYNNSGKLLRSISLNEPTGIAFDRAGHLFVSEAGSQKILEYGNQGRKLLRTITNNVKDPGRLAFDPTGNLYDAERRSINVYPKATGKRFQRLKYRTQGMVFDSVGNLYARTGYNTVSIFAPGAKTPTGTINIATSNLGGPIALDSNGNLLVGNQFAQTGNGYSDLEVYSTTSPYPMLQQITNGINGPAGLAFDAQQNLYVVNYFNIGDNPNSVAVLPPGYSTPIRYLTQGLNEPNAIAIDPGGDVFVANYAQSTIVEFSPGSSSVVRTITDGVSYPTILAMGP